MVVLQVPVQQNEVSRNHNSRALGRTVQPSRVQFLYVTKLVVAGSILFGLGGLFSRSSTNTPEMKEQKAPGEMSSSHQSQSQFRVKYASITNHPRWTISCKKTILFQTSVNLDLLELHTHINDNDDGLLDDLLCVRTMNDIVGLIVHEDSIWRASDYPLYEKWLLRDHPSTSFRILDRKDVIMGSGFTTCQGRYELPETDEINAIRDSGGNTGNFVWQYGATNMLNPYTTRFVEEKDMVTAAAFIIASANLFHLNKAWPEDEKRHLAMADVARQKVVQYDLPTIVLGIGIQIAFTSKTMNITTASFGEGYDAYRQMLQEIGARQSSRSIAVRGDVTEKVCMNTGINQCISLGCPSLTINRDLNLGTTLGEKWDSVMKTLRSGNTTKAKELKVAITLPADGHTDPEYKRMVDILLSIYQQHDCYFIMQDSGDKNKLQRHASGKFQLARLVTFEHSVESWFDFMSEFDLVVSTRIHGGMAGIARGVPVVFVPTDFRILELVEAMELPFLSLEKLDTKRHSSLINILEDVPFDTVKFEANRREKIKEYKRILADVGLEIDPELEAIIKQ